VASRGGGEPGEGQTMREVPKLPQARMYLKAARWGFDSLLDQKLSGTGFRFFMIGILSTLRAVQHSLYNHDRHISPEHDDVISKWWIATGDLACHPERRFIKEARDQILKKGSFDSFAIYHESSTGPANDPIITSVNYELEYYNGDQRRDLAADIRSAIDWCERELGNIESDLPSRYEQDELSERDFAL
jgi:hypothetical protein